MGKRKGIVICLLWAAALALVPALGVSAASAGAAPVKYAALTFDDGPWPGTTRKLLDGLKERGAKATFFVIGRQVGYRPELILRMEAEGHQIGLHTWDHVALRGMGREEILRQLELSRDVLELLTGRRDFMLRPPYGFVDETVSACAQAPIICWSLDTEDWRDENVERVVKSVLSSVEDGDIILMHDIFSSSVTAALECVDQLQAQGFELVTVEELLALRGVTPEAGQVYRKAPV